MDITVQYFDDCPNWLTTDCHLREVIERHGIDAVIGYQLIETPEDAEENGFRGSPTF